MDANLTQLIASSIDKLSKADRRRLIKDQTLDNLNKVEKYNVNYLGNIFKVDPRLIVLILNELKVSVSDCIVRETKQVNESDDDQLELWAESLNALQRRRIRKRAQKEGISPSEVLLLRANEIKDPQKRSEVKNKLANEVKDLNKSELKAIKFPDHITVTSWDDIISNEENEAMKAHLTQAKGICLQLVNGEQEAKCYKTFLNDKGEQKHLDIIKDEVMAIIESECSDTFIEIEKKYSTKVGSFKTLPYYKWVEKVIGLWKDIEFNPNQDVLDESINFWKSELKQILELTTGSSVLTPSTLEEAYEKVTKGRNSGYPFFTSKWAEDKGMVEYYKAKANEMLEGKFDNSPRILFKRTQYNGTEAKMRPVECPPKSEAIAAKCFTDVILTSFKNHPQFVGFKGGGNIAADVAPLLDKQYLLSSDFSAFDTTCKNFIPIIFNMLDEISDYKHSAYFKNIQEYYLHSELLTPNGLLSSKLTNGLNSGDGWTSVIGTLSNAIANTYVLALMKINADVLSYGDDCVVASNEYIDIQLYADYMAQLGLVCNPEKQELTHGDKAYFSFLGYYYLKEDKHLEYNKMAKFPIMRSLSSLIYFERFNKVEDLITMVSLTEEERTKILESKRVGIELLGHLMKLDNCRNNEAFESFVVYFKQHEKFQMKTNLIMPMEKLMSTMRQLRYQRGESLANSPTMKLLLTLEYGENYETMINVTIMVNNSHIDQSAKQEIVEEMIRYSIFLGKPKLTIMLQPTLMDPDTLMFNIFDVLVSEMHNKMSKSIKQFENLVMDKELDDTIIQ